MIEIGLISSLNSVQRIKEAMKERQIDVNDEYRRMKQSLLSDRSQSVDHVVAVE